MNSCEVADCPKLREKRQWCNAHYRRWLAKGDPEAGAPPRKMTPVPCSVDGCPTNARTQGLCIKHHRRWKATGDPLGIKNGRGLSLIDRFMSRVEKDDADGCWLWTAGGSGNGYGRFAISHDTNVTAHRWHYEHHHGPIPEGMQLDHLCRVRNCVNLDHLELVTARENILRGQTVSAANARKTHCKNGHPFDEQNTHVTPRGTRRCRSCAREAQRRYQERKKANA